MKKLLKHLNTVDVLNILNLPVALMAIYLNRYFIILTAVLFVSAIALALIKKRREESNSFFRYMWSFIASGFGYASDIHLLENTTSILIASIVAASVLIYFLTRSSRKSIIVLLFYALCLGTFFYSMTIAANRTFDKSEAMHITAVVSDKSSLRSGKYLDIYSEEAVDGKVFCEASLRCTNKAFEEYTIGDKIIIIIKNGAFGIKYYQVAS